MLEWWFCHIVINSVIALKVHEYYERWLIHSLPRAPHAPVLIIDGNVDIDSMFTNCEKDIPVIFGKKKIGKEESKENLSPSKKIKSTLVQ